MPLRANNPDVTTTGSITVTYGTGYIVTDSVFQTSDSTSQRPVSLKVTPSSSSPTEITSTLATASGDLSFNYTSPPPGSDSPNGSLLDFRSSAGFIEFQDPTSININWTTNLVPASDAQIGMGAITVVGTPMHDGTGAGVGLTNTGTITVNLPTATTLTGTTLSPGGLRMADLSGLLAVSYGDQGNPSNTTPSGTVTANTYASSAITMTSAVDSVLVAGISASGAVGNGNTDGISTTDRLVNVNNAGTINVTAGSGVGIIATSTGAQFAHSGDSVAYAGPVTVNLLPTSSITVTGTTGIGVFAVSEAYTTSDQPKHSSVSGGVVTIKLDANSDVTVGNSTSQMSIGVLGVSTGTDALLNPFTSGSVNKDGSGSGGQVNITNNGGIMSTGTMSIGIAALSTGGAGISTNTDSSSSGYSYLGNSGSSADGTPENGDQVNVTNNGGITTLGAGAAGIVAISSGGGGLINNNLLASASGGLIVGNNETSSSGTATLGGSVTVNNNGSILTGGSGAGNASIGIIAQSIGGAGGSASGDKPALFVGDNAGAGGAGGDVYVNTGVGSILATQDSISLGILAESIGGGGGNGGNARGIFVSVGGKGGNGGNGGAIDLNLSGTIITVGDNAASVVAHSIGGGGGNGGGSSSVGYFLDAAIGGKGGGGGMGGTVTGTLQATSNILTLGNNSAGMLLESIGGGGGNGGAALSGAGFILSSGSISLGGAGAHGGSGGNVSGSNAGIITTGASVSGTLSGLPSIDGADSDGITIQSIGGGGGHGGSAVAKTLTFQAPEPALNIGFSLAFGGSGAEAGHGGSSSFSNLGTITTSGDGSHALLVQSIGGGGGDGGDSTASSALLSVTGVEAALDIAFGGTGGGGGNGGSVSATNGISVDGTMSSATANIITTYGQDAAGIVAQSIGGGGGNGGLGNAKANTPTLSGDTSSFVSTVSLGGSGGAGGTGSPISVLNGGVINTYGSGSQGILAQAIGGGGGDAGGATSVASNNNVTINVAVGGSGGSGALSNTGTSTIRNYNTISTRGGDATGIVAQSIGGGGGVAGSSDAKATIGTWGQITGQLASSFKYTSNIVIGRAGGSGGAGGNVEVDNWASTPPNENTATITTQGDRAHGILAQSISGGGGVGGSATAFSNSTYFEPFNGNFNGEVTLAMGGAGGDSNNAGNVLLQNSGIVSTSGYSSQGLFAQSIGGGGGVAADGSINIHSTLGLGIDINGANGESGSGGTVTISQNGKVLTTGRDSAGILAQSIGGGGGVGSTGLDFEASFSGAGHVSIGANVTLGFNLNNSALALGGTVNISSGPSSSWDPSGGVISTAGDWSPGIIGQSIGGGGGKTSTIYGTNNNDIPDLAVQVGATKGKGTGGEVDITLTGGSITTGSFTSGYSSFGIVGQSIGGGGGIAVDGSASSTGSITMGGASSEVSGDGGAVNLSGSTTLVTNGYGAHGIVLQSIGGGGGIAGSGSSLSTPSGTTTTFVKVGGDGAIGAGGNVTVNNPLLNITTHGDNAYGMVAQSIGGGGGLATVYNGTAPGNGGNEGILGRLGGINESGTNNYNGGNVSVTLDPGSSITTTGLGAHAVVIQSIGGGGGIANPYAYSGANSGLTTSLGHGNSADTGGVGGAITANINGNISTSGDGAYGVILQSVAGGGGIYGNYAGSTGTGELLQNLSNGNIIMTQGGSISTTGTNSVGVFIQSTGPAFNGQGLTMVTVNGTVTGGSGSRGYGIWFDGGESNTLKIASTGTVSSASGTAVNYTGGLVLNIENQGTVNGSVITQGGAFANTGILNSGSLVDAFVASNGLVNPGGDGPATQTQITGGLGIAAGSTLKFDIYSDFQYDNLIDGTGNFIKVQGTILADFSHANLLNGDYVFTLIGAGDNDYNGFDLQTIGLQSGWTVTSHIQSNNSFDLDLMVVPEPNVPLLMLLGVFGLLFYRRCRNRPVSTK